VSRFKKWLGKEETPAVAETKKSTQVPPKLEKKSGLKSNVIKQIEVDFYRYLISKSLLLPDEVEYNSEIPDNRILLDIELAPALARQAEKQESKDLFNALKAQLFQDVEARVENKLANIPTDLWNRFTIDDNLLDAVNILMTKAASISRIKPLILKDASLLRNFVNVLNRLGMGKKNSDKPLEPKDAELCLSSLGVEKLRLLMPYLIMHESMKESGAKFNQTSRKIWQHVQITATAAHALAKESGDVNPDEAYILALFHEMGATFLLHLVEDCFSESRRDISKQAMDSGASEVSHQLAEIKSAIPVLERVLPKVSRKLSIDIADKYQLSFLRLTTIYSELAQTMSYDDLSPMAQTIAQARCYSVFKQLFKEELIDKRQAAALLNYYQVDSAKIKLLNSQKYLKIPKLEA